MHPPEPPDSRGRHSQTHPTYPTPQGGASTAPATMWAPSPPPRPCLACSSGGVPAVPEVPHSPCAAPPADFGLRTLPDTHLLWHG
eukprot:5773325-Prymnesium_polylepis.1